MHLTLVFFWNVWEKKLGDAKDVMEAIQNIEGTRFPVLTPNLKVSCFISIIAVKRLILLAIGIIFAQIFLFPLIIGFGSSSCSRSQRSGYLCCCFWVFFKGQHQLQHWRQSQTVPWSYSCSWKTINSSSWVYILSWIPLKVHTYHFPHIILIRYHNFVDIYPVLLVAL